MAACAAIPFIVLVLNNYVLPTGSLWLGFLVTVCGCVLANVVLLFGRTRRSLHQTARISFLGGAMYAAFLFVAAIMRLILPGNRGGRALPDFAQAGIDRLDANAIIQMIAGLAGALCLFVTLFMLLSILTSILLCQIQGRLAAQHQTIGTVREWRT